VWACGTSLAKNASGALDRDTETFEKRTPEAKAVLTEVWFWHG
jgi:hypothetical protein